MGSSAFISTQGKLHQVFRDQDRNGIQHDGGQQFIYPQFHFKNTWNPTIGSTNEHCSYYDHQGMQDGGKVDGVSQPGSGYCPEQILPFLSNTEHSRSKGNHGRQSGQNDRRGAFKGSDEDTVAILLA